MWILLQVAEVTGRAVDEPVRVEPLNRAQWSRRFLDDERPLLERLSGSIGAALQAQLGELDADGEPTGVIREGFAIFPDRRIPEDDLRRYYSQVIPERWNEKGYTSVYTIASLDQLPVLRELTARGGGTLRYTVALHADPGGPSEYLRSRGRGEAALRSEGEGLAVTILKPSVIFGRDDSFLNLFAGLQRIFPLMPLGNTQARFQPVYVEDVARAFVNSLDSEATVGKAYELAGPKVYTLRELVQFASGAAGHRRPVVALPDGIARLQARLMEFAPGEPLLSRDNLDSMKRDNVASRQPYAPAPELGITATPMEPEASLYLAGLHPRSRFGGFRARARR